MAVTLIALAAVLASCGGISDETVGADDLHFFVHNRTLLPPSGGLDAEVIGALTAADGCVLLDQDGNRYPVVWPRGTDVAGTEPLVVELPSSEQLRLGEQVRGGGGYLKADTLDIDVPAECLNEHSEVAVFNPGDDPMVVGTSDTAPSAAATPPGPAPVVGGLTNPPPPAWVEATSGAVWMAYSSYCWGDECADMVPPEEMPDVPQVEVSEGAKVTFHLGFDPAEVELSFPDRGDYVSLPADRAVSWTVTEFGFVVLSARPDGIGDASYVAQFVASSTDTPGSGEAPVSVFRGAEHCGWDSVRVLRVSADVAAPRTEGDQWVDFVHDSEGVLPDRLVFGEYEADATVPADAVATGHETPSGSLWLAPSEPDAAYLITDSTTERWPAAYPGCD